MQSIINQMRRYDWLLMGAVLLLIVFGLLTLFSLSSVSAFPYAVRQLTWVGIGIVLCIAVSSIDFRLFKTQSVIVFVLYCITVFLLSMVLFAHLRIRGIEGWLTIGGFFVQPVELTKIALIILLAKFFSKRHVEIYRTQHIFVSGLYVALPAGLVLLQPDLGSAIILVTIWLAMVLLSGMKLRHFFLLVVLGAMLFGIGWEWGLAPYQKSRITSFLNPYNDPKGAGYQMIQSMIAVGSGRMWGKGLGYGSQSHLNFLPEAETDFIFAAFAEEWGFVGIASMLVLFAIVLWRILRIGQHASDNFSRLYALGFAALIFSQVFIHVGMNMGLMPITGITLPFVSYGGSSLVTLLIGVGVLQNIKMNSRKRIEEG